MFVMLTCDHPDSLYSQGLKLVLYMEVMEYLEGITTGYGARIQVHEPGTYPYPVHEGMHVPASMETSIGLKLVRACLMFFLCCFFRGKCE